MIGAAVVEILFGVKAERKSLEELHQYDHQPTQTSEHSITTTDTTFQNSTTISLFEQTTKGLTPPHSLESTTQEHEPLNSSLDEFQSSDLNDHIVVVFSDNTKTNSCSNPSE
jgi:hypothetical protein